MDDLRAGGGGGTEHGWSAVLLAWLTTRTVLLFVVFVSMVAIPLVQKFQPEAHASPNVVIDGLVRWDSWSYVYIVTRGYTAGNAATGDLGTIAVFPLYPLLTRLIASVTGDVFVAGIVLSHAALLVGLYYVYQLARQEFDAPTAERAVWYLAAAPAAIFFSAMYSESFFVALVAATFYYARRGHWLAAALGGALAAATRNTGFLLAGVVAIEGVMQARAACAGSGWGRAWLARVWPSLLAAATVPLGLIAYMAYLGVAFGDPLGFIHVQAEFQRNVSPLGWLDFPTRAVQALQLGPDPLAGQIDPAILIDTLATLVFGILVVGVIRTMRPSYSFYAVLSFLIPGLSSATLFSMNRYSLMLIPCFLVLAHWARRRWADRMVLAVSLPLMAYVAVTFSHNLPPV